MKCRACGGEDIFYNKHFQIECRDCFATEWVGEFINRVFGAGYIFVQLMHGEAEREDPDFKILILKNDQNKTQVGIFNFTTELMTSGLEYPGDVVVLKVAKAKLEISQPYEHVDLFRRLIALFPDMKIKLHLESVDPKFHACPMCGKVQFERSMEDIGHVVCKCGQFSVNFITYIKSILAHQGNYILHTPPGYSPSTIFVAMESAPYKIKDVKDPVTDTNNIAKIEINSMGFKIAVVVTAYKWTQHPENLGLANEVFRLLAGWTVESTKIVYANLKDMP